MKKNYGLDTRSIAAFRILLSIFIAAEFAFSVLGNFGDIYSPESGILGNAFAADYHTYYKGFIGIFFIRSDSGMLFFIWLIIIVMVLLASGFYTRITAITGCVLLYLFFNRYSLLYLGWDMYASAMLFWLAFVPNDTCYSFFRTRKITITNGYEWSSPIAFALLFQIGMIYFYNGISKNGELWMSGRAVESFINDTDKARPFATWLFQQKFLDVLLTYFTLAIEIGIIFILFIPWKNKQLRYVAAFLIFSLHWGIDVFVDVGLFKYVATAAAVLLLPGDFWSKCKNLIPLKYVSKLINRIPKIILPEYRFSLSTKLKKVIAFALCFMMVFSNLSQTNASMTNDRIKHIIDFLHIDTLLKKIDYHVLPQYSFFTQYWHLYSPDPPQENGYMQVEAVTANNDTLPLFNGVPLVGKRFCSTAQHNFFTYLLLKKGRNEKEKIAEKYLVLREIRMWNKQQGNPKLRNILLVIYSHSFNKDASVQSGSEKIIYKTIDVKYRQ